MINLLVNKENNLIEDELNTCSATSVTSRSWIKHDITFFEAAQINYHTLKFHTMNFFWLIFLAIYSFSSFQSVSSIRCYQCSSDEDKTTDSCGAYEPFDINKNSPVDCMAEDAVTPGTFCYKSIQQGPRGFIWDGRWRTVIRRCAQISERGISWGCDWGFHENGVFWEECYCAEDGCNGSTSLFAKGSQFYMMPLSLAIGIIMTIFLSVSS